MNVSRQLAGSFFSVSEGLFDDRSLDLSGVASVLGSKCSALYALIKAHESTCIRPFSPVNRFHSEQGSLSHENTQHS